MRAHSTICLCFLSATPFCFGVRARKLVNKTMCRTKMLEGIRSEFSTIISSQNFDFGIKLILNSCFKELKDIKNIKLVFKKVKPSKFRILINKENVILKIICGCDRSWTPNIRMHQFKRL